MKELSIDEIREMDTKKIQRAINDLRKQQVAGNTGRGGNTGGMQPNVEPQELKQIHRSIARCKTVLNERGPKVKSH